MTKKLIIKEKIQFNKSQHVGINKKIYRMGKFYIGRDADKHGGGEYKIEKKTRNTSITSPKCLVLVHGCLSY